MVVLWLLDALRWQLAALLASFALLVLLRRVLHVEVGRWSPLVFLLVPLSFLKFPSFARSGLDSLTGAVSVSDLAWMSDLGGLFIFVSVVLLLSFLLSLSPRFSRLRGAAPLLLVTLALFLLVEVHPLVSDVRYTSLARVLTGDATARVQCQRLWQDITFTGFAGVTYWDVPVGDSRVTVATLMYSTCEDLDSFDVSDTSNHSVHVLLHEIVHVAGESDESVTDCTASWLTPPMFELLGFGRSPGEEFMLSYARDVEPVLPSRYRAPSCLDGPAPHAELLERFESLLPSSSSSS